MSNLDFSVDIDPHRGRIETLVEDAYESDTNETQRWRPPDGDIEEVRIRRIPMFGLHLEVDISLSEEQCERVVPGDIMDSAVEEEIASTIDAKDDVTRLHEAVDSETYDWFVREIAAAQGADREVPIEEEETKEEAVRETLNKLGLCSRLFASGDHHVATFSAYV